LNIQAVFFSPDPLIETTILREKSPLPLPKSLQRPQDLTCVSPFSIAENDQCPHGIAAGTELQDMNLGEIRHPHPKAINEINSCWKLVNL
jgi:hypothetical protein